MSVAPLTSAELTDVRRFCGYPVSTAISAQDLATQGNSASLDAFLATLSDDAITTLRTVYLANLATLETAIPGASDLLYVDKAAVFTRNANEVAERENLFVSWRQKLCAFLGVAPGPGIFVTGLASLAPAAFVV